MRTIDNTLKPRTWLGAKLGLCALLAASAFTAGADVAGKVADLAWMTGSWAGPVGNGTLEENWIRPEGASIASLVRMTGDGATSMVELIVIEQEDDSLVLRIQQWDPGFSPRTDAPQTMHLAAIGENRVSFAAAGEGSMRSLGYSRPTPDTFVIDVETAGGAFQINLKAR